MPGVTRLSFHMRLLLIESTPGNARQISDRLAAEGHDVVMCSDEHGPCRGMSHHEHCPVEQHTDLTIVAREPNSQRTLDEMGSVCASRHRIPTVEVDPRDPSAVDGITVTHAMATRAVTAGYAAAVRNEVPFAEVHVERIADLVHVTLTVPADKGTPQALSAAADRARKAVREHDPYVKGIDVSVVAESAS